MLLEVPYFTSKWLCWCASESHCHSISYVAYMMLEAFFKCPRSNMLYNIEVSGNVICVELPLDVHTPAWFAATLCGSCYWWIPMLNDRTNLSCFKLVVTPKSPFDRNWHSTPTSKMGEEREKNQHTNVTLSCKTSWWGNCTLTFQFDAYPFFTALSSFFECCPILGAANKPLGL